MQELCFASSTNTSLSMITMIKDVLRELIINKHGKDGWTKVQEKIEVLQNAKKCNSSASDGFRNDTIFGDSLDFTREIINVISHVLGQNVDDFLREIGQATFLMFIQSPEGKVLQSLGSSLCDFLNNIDNFVDIVVQSQQLNDAKPPSFRCEPIKDGHSLELHYYSKRKGWEPCVIGAVTCAAKVLFYETVTMDVKKDSMNNSNGDMDHTVFEIRQEIEHFTVNKGIDSTDPHELAISVPTLCCAFPCHIVFDDNMDIQQLGVALLRMIGHSLTQHGTSMSTYFELIKPDISFTFNSILQRTNGSFQLKLKPTSLDDSKSLMELKGQMIQLPESNCILFLASPLVKKLEQLKGRGLFLSDIPIHDATRDLILVSEQAHAQDGIKRRMEQLQTELEKASRELEEEKKKTEDLLGSIFPHDVAQKLINKQSVPARFIENVTMLFSDIVGFTSICGKCTAMEVVEMLEDLYTEFDKICGELDLYKVETIGDAYVVAGGVQNLRGTTNDGYRVAKMALGMIDFLENVLSPEGVPLKMRVGIHTGSVLSGVVGTKMPRYCLFGHDVTIANKMETESEAGRINVSPTAYDLIRHCNEFKFIRRPRSSLPDGFKMDKLSGSCYFLERGISETRDQDVLWQKLASPRRRRDTSPSKSPRPHRKDADLTSSPVHTKKNNTLERTDVTSNGNGALHNDVVQSNENCTFHKDTDSLNIKPNDRLQKDINNEGLCKEQEEEGYCFQSFKETSV